MYVAVEEMAEGCLLRSVSDTVAHLARLRELHVVERSDWRSEGSSWTAACLGTRMVAYVETDVSPHLCFLDAWNH